MSTIQISDIRIGFSDGKLPGLTGRLGFPNISLHAAVIALYALSLWALAMFVAVRPVLLKVLVPILLVLYLAPFVTAPDRVAGIVRRTRRRDDDLPRPPMKNVTPPDGPTGAP